MVSGQDESKDEALRVTECVEKLYDTLKVFSEHQDSDEKNQQFIIGIKQVLTLFNETLCKGGLNNKQNLRFAYALLSNEKFVALRDKVESGIFFGINNISNLGIEDKYELYAKLAIFLSNKHYALMIMAGFPERARYADQVLFDCNRAIELCESCFPNLVTLMSFGVDIDQLTKDEATAISESWIPLLYLRSRLFKGIYNEMLSNKSARCIDIDCLYNLDAACMIAMDRPCHLLSAKLEAETLQDLVTSSDDPTQLKNCLREIQQFLGKNQQLWAEGGVLVEWHKHVGIGMYYELQGQCLLKLKRFTEAFCAFDSAYEYFKSEDNAVRAKRNMLFIAQTMRNSQIDRCNTYFLPDSVASHYAILQVLETAENIELDPGHAALLNEEIQEMKSVIKFEQENIKYFFVDREYVGIVSKYLKKKPITTQFEEQKNKPVSLGKRIPQAVINPKKLEEDSKKKQDNIAGVFKKV